MRAAGDIHEITQAILHSLQWSQIPPDLLKKIQPLPLSFEPPPVQKLPHQRRHAARGIKHVTPTGATLQYHKYCQLHDRNWSNECRCTKAHLSHDHM